VKNGARANVHDNLVEDNELDNFATEGNIVHDLPKGTGIFVIASDNNEIHANTVQNHQSLGIAVVSWFVTLRDDEGQADPLFDWYPEGNFVHDNVLSNNGHDPEGQAAVIASIIGATTLTDIAWDGAIDAAKVQGDGGAVGEGGVDDLENCFARNGDATFVNIDILHLGANKSFDVTPYVCDHPALPPVGL
jgi:hypothetical protein